MNESASFNDALEQYRQWVSYKVNLWFAQYTPNLDKPTISVAPRGRKYKKLVMYDGTQKTVHSFVEVSTGDIFKPASWKAPAKHARGNIYKDRGNEALTDNGSVRYLR